MPKKEITKNIGGRPHEYKPEFCDIAVSVLAEKYGNGRETVAARLNTTTQSIRNWRKKYPEFDKAMSVGLNKSKAALFEFALKFLVGNKDANFNTPLFNRILQTVFRDDENAAVEIDGWANAKTISDKFNLITQKLGEGEITAEQADKFSNVLTKHLQAIKIDEFEARLKALEKD